MCQKIATAESDPSFSMEVSFSFKAANTIFCEKQHNHNPHSIKHQQQHKMVKSKAAGKVTLGVLYQGKQKKMAKQGAGTGFHQVYFYKEATMKLCRGCGVAAALLVQLASRTLDMQPGCFYGWFTMTLA